MIFMLIVNTGPGRGRIENDAPRSGQTADSVELPEGDGLAGQEHVRKHEETVAVELRENLRHA